MVRSKHPVLCWARQESGLLNGPCRRTSLEKNPPGRELDGSQPPRLAFTSTIIALGFWSIRPYGTSAKNWSPAFDGTTAFNLNG